MKTQAALSPEKVICMKLTLPVLSIRPCDTNVHHISLKNVDWSLLGAEKVEFRSHKFTLTQNFLLGFWNYQTDFSLIGLVLSVGHGGIKFLVLPYAFEVLSSPDLCYILHAGTLQKTSRQCKLLSLLSRKLDLRDLFWRSLQNMNKNLLRYY